MFERMMYILEKINQILEAETIYYTLYEGQI